MDDNAEKEEEGLESETDMMLYQKENENTKKVSPHFKKSQGKFLIDVLAEELSRLDSRSK